MSAKNLTNKRLATEMRLMGFSLGEISARLSVSKSTVSYWVKNVSLSSSARTILDSKNPSSCFYSGDKKPGSTNRDVSRTKREEYQLAGFSMIDNGDDTLFAVGCALYWGEGSKKRNSVVFTNSDKNAVRVFSVFLRRFFSDHMHKARIYIHHRGQISDNEIVKYWREISGVEDIRPYLVKDKRGQASRSKKHPYGIARVEIHSTEIVQKIYGAINKIAGTSGEWIF